MINYLDEKANYLRLTFFLTRKRSIVDQLTSTAAKRFG